MQINIQQMPNDHQNKNPKSLETNLLQLQVQVGDQKQLGYEGQKRLYFKNVSHYIQEQMQDVMFV